jgi:hypothetical protein
VILLANLSVSWIPLGIMSMVGATFAVATTTPIGRGFIAFLSALAEERVSA